MKRSYSIVMTVVASVALSACDRASNPVAPVAAIGDIAGGDVRVTGVPRAVIKTTPPANAEGVIVGGSPLTVQFNLCQSRPAQEDDNLKFTYDFDGDGAVDAFGHCRAEHVYRNGGSTRSCTTARVCVSDRRPDGEVCRSYDVCVEEGEPEHPELRPDGDDDGDPAPGGAPEGNDFDLQIGDRLRRVTGNQEYEFVGALERLGDEDYFKLENPTNDGLRINIDACSTQVQRLRVTIRDAAGVFVWTRVVECGDGENDFHLRTYSVGFLGIMTEGDDQAGIDYKLKLKTEFLK